MDDKTYDVVGLGSAIVDAITHADERFLEEWGIEKGGMTLIDEQRAHLLYDAMGPASETSGGSAANTVAGVASFGGTAGLHRHRPRRPVGRDLPPRHPGLRGRPSTSPPAPTARRRLAA